MDLDLGGGPTLYCTICGGPVHGPTHRWSLSPKSKWLGEAILLSSSGELEGSPSPSVIEVSLLDDIHFRIKHTHEVVIPLNLRGEPFQPNSRLYFHCHKSCLQVAQKALARYERHPLQSIWKSLILRARQVKKICPSALYYFNMEPPVKWPGIWKFQAWEWLARDSDEESSVNSIPFSQSTYWLRPRCMKQILAIVQFAIPDSWNI